MNIFKQPGDPSIFYALLSLCMIRWSPYFHNDGLIVWTASIGAERESTSWFRRICVRLRVWCELWLRAWSPPNKKEQSALAMRKLTEKSTKPTDEYSTLTRFGSPSPPSWKSKLTVRSLVTINLARILSIGGRLRTECFFTEQELLLWTMPSTYISASVKSRKNRVLVGTRRLGWVGTKQVGQAKKLQAGVWGLASRLQPVTAHSWTVAIWMYREGLERVHNLCRGGGGAMIFSLAIFGTPFYLVCFFLPPPPPS